MPFMQHVLLFDYATAALSGTGGDVTWDGVAVAMVGR